MNDETKTTDDFSNSANNEGGGADHEDTPFSWDKIPKNEGEKIKSVGGRMNRDVPGGWERIATFEKEDGSQETRPIPDFDEEQEKYIGNTISKALFDEPKP